MPCWRRSLAALGVSVLMFAGQAGAHARRLARQQWPSVDQRHLAVGQVSQGKGRRQRCFDAADATAKDTNVWCHVTCRRGALKI